MLNKLLRYRKSSSRRAQAMVEFAIVAPILFLMLLGIIEVGRMVFLYAAVTNASREAVRYGSAVGLDDATQQVKYRNCKAIRDLAKSVSYFANATVQIEYDEGVNPDGTRKNPVPCNTDIYPGYRKSGDRVMVMVTAQYRPYTSLIPWGTRQISSRSYRTILGFVGVSGVSGGGGVVGGASTATATATATFTMGPSETPTDTPTATATFGDFATFTPIVTDTGTPTNEPTSTPTYTLTPTAVPECSDISGGNITVNSNYMAMTITNPFTTVTVSTVQVAWNTVAGSPSQNALLLKSAILGDLFWTGTDNSGDLLITPSTDLTIPGNNAQSTILFVFDDNYDHPDGSESITITLSTPGCESVTIHATLPTPVP